MSDSYNIIEETNDYWIVDNKIIFKLNFNKNLDEYDELFNIYNDVVFCDNNDLSSLFTRKKFIDCKGSQFDQKILLNNNIKNLMLGKKFNKLITSNKELSKLTHLTFGCVNIYTNEAESFFNQPLELNENLTHLTFCYYSKFNKPLELNNKLTHLVLGLKFNQKLKFNDNITHLSLEKYFNQNINLPNSLQYLRIMSNLQNIIDSLPNNIHELIIGTESNLNLDNLPNNIKIISFTDEYKYNKKLNNLPDSVECLQLPCSYDIRVDKLPKNLKKIKCKPEYKYIDDFILKYDIDHNYNHK